MRSVGRAPPARLARLNNHNGGFFNERNMSVLLKWCTLGLLPAGDGGGGQVSCLLKAESSCVRVILARKMNRDIISEIETA